MHPAPWAQVSYFHRLGLHERTLSFVVMIAFVLEMIWRQIGNVGALKTPAILSNACSGALISGAVHKMQSKPRFGQPGCN
jgi:hypothetical protein